MGPGGVSLDAYRAVVGSWSAAVGGGWLRVLLATKSRPPAFRSPVLSVLFLFLLLRASGLLRHGDVKPNPGPSSSTSLESSCPSPLSSIRRQSSSSTNLTLRKGNYSPEVSSHARPQLRCDSTSSSINRGADTPAVAGDLSHTNCQRQRKLLSATETASGLNFSSRTPASSQPQRRHVNSELQVPYSNARSFSSKHAELSDLVASSAAYSPHLVAITETWLNGDVPDGTVVLPGYGRLFRTDRPSMRRGGGVLILARDDVKCVRRDDLQLWEESVWIELELILPGKSVVLGCVYQPPSFLSADVEHFINDMDATLEKLDRCRSHVAVVEDFNATSSQWCSTDMFNAAGRALDPALLRLGLHQAVSFPTHLRPDGSLSSLLDLLLVSSADLVSRVSSLPPLGKSNHVVLQCVLNSLPKVVAAPTHLRRLWNYDVVDFGEVNNLPSKLDWSPVLHATTIDEAWDLWKDLFFSVINKKVPSKIIARIRPKSR